MLKCICCDEDLQKGSEIMRGYCDECQTHVRTVFDKDAYALGQYKRTRDGNYINDLEWTTTTNLED